MKITNPLLQLLNHRKIPKNDFYLWDIRRCQGNNNILKNYVINENKIVLMDITQPLLELL